MAGRRGEPTVRIAIDAMGGDAGPGVAVTAARQALTSDPLLELTLFATRDAMGTDASALPDGLSVHATAGHIPQDCTPGQALRRGEGTSMHAALEALADGRADAVVSSGNTGALMALARARPGTLAGIERPALMTAFPLRDGCVRVLDLGANINVDARRLVEFAVMGNAACTVLMGRPPRIGLLNIGREPCKGPDPVREAGRMLAASDMDYHGYVEGHDVFAGVVDLVVCDGFAGNILLKSAEGAIGMHHAVLEETIGRGLIGMLTRRRLAALRERFDPTRHNGASLLGIDGIVIKSHGHAGVRAFARAIALAATEVRQAMLPELERQLWASH